MKVKFKVIVVAVSFCVICCVIWSTLGKKTKADSPLVIDTEKVKVDYQEVLSKFFDNNDIKSDYAGADVSYVDSIGVDYTIAYNLSQNLTDQQREELKNLLKREFDVPLLKVKVSFIDESFLKMVGEKTIVIRLAISRSNTQP